MDEKDVKVDGRNAFSHKKVVYLHRIYNQKTNRMMNNADFWASVRAISAKGFTPEGLLKLDSYAEQFE